MTLIQPNKKIFDISRIYFFGLFLLIFSGVFWMITLYNTSVDLEHAVKDARVTMRNMESSNAELKDKMLRLLSRESLVQIAKERGLVEDRSPHYIATVPQWEFASQSH